MSWQVIYNRKKFQKQRLPVMVSAAVELLIAEIEQCGPVRGNWSNYSKLPNVSCPVSNADRIRQYLEKHGCICVGEEQEWADAKGLFAERTPATMLIGARGKENITQLKLSQLTGIPRRHISDIENGRRPIGKQNAMKLGKALNVNYRVFL